MDLEAVTFLVVEDNPHMRQLIRLVLSSFNARKVKEATDGADALKLMRTFVPDVIVTNWHMQPLDGLEMTRMLRTSEDSPNPFVPVIMVTGHSERGRVLAARDAGVTEFLVKPISARSLYSRIETVIKRPRRFVRTKNYFGPDRRRKDDPKYRGPKRREVDTPEAQAAREEAMRESLDQDSINRLFGDKGD